MILRVSFFVIVVLFIFGTSVRPGNLLAQSKKEGPKSGSLKEFTGRHHPSDTVAVVDGVLITFADFNSIMAGYLKQFVAESKNDVVTDSLYTTIVDSAWARALSDILVEREIEKRKLSLDLPAIKDSLVHAPPKYLRQQFTDSTGTFQPEKMRTALNDPRNDTVVSVILEGERVRLETERLVTSVAKKGASPEERDRAFATWLRKAKQTAKIDDRRTRFGFY
ncbi:MAG TPA: SurA N-terminal domain-containing protein [Candidatus Kapabacteria bacterium]